MQTKPVDDAAVDGSFAPLLRACIHVQNPYPDCYCMNISAASIPRMLEYCVGEYLSCPVFLSMRNKGRSAD